MKILLLIILLFVAPANAKAKIIIAIIDTGIDLQSEQIRPYLWNNPREIANNNIDDDRNGLVDDIHGWNFAGNNSNLKDTHGHGTHIAGLTLVGQNPENVQIMILKYYSESTNNLDASLKSLQYAIKMGAKIINYSGGGPERSTAELKLLKMAEAKNIMLVAAAGNESSNLATSPFYPANYNLSNIITVGAFNLEGSLLKYSNFNQREVDIAAFGEKVFSFLPQNKRGPMTGTSQATALVTAELAKFISQNSTTRNIVIQKRNFLRQQPRSTKLLGKVKYGTYLNLSEKKLASKD